MVIDSDGPLCSCGHRGHLEAFASGPSIARIARERLEAGETSLIRELVDGDLDQITSVIVGRAAQMCDPLANMVIEQAGHRIALFSIAAFLVVGLLALLFVNEKKGRAAAQLSEGERSA